MNTVNKKSLTTYSYNPLLIDFKRQPRRILFCAQTNSGKTYNIIKLTNAHIDEFKHIIIFSPIYGKKDYVNGIKKGSKIIFVTIGSDIKTKTHKEVVEKLTIIYEELKIYEIKETDTNSRILIILDDVLDEKLMQEPIIQQSIKNWRHNQVSIFLASQYPNVMVSQLVKANIDTVFIFNTNNAMTVSYFKRDFIKQTVKLVLRDDGINMIKDEDINKICDDLYYNYVVDRPYGFLCISYMYNHCFPNPNKKLIMIGKKD